MYTAIEISKWFLLKNHGEIVERNANDGFNTYEGISPLKIQKLLYYAQGIYLAKNNKPLFNEDIVAWPHGPVVVEVYEKYKNFGSKDIKLEFNSEYKNIIEKIEVNDSITRKVLDITYYNFAIYTAWKLREMTHTHDSPWYKTKINNIIENDLIKEYFLSNVSYDDEE